MLLSGDITARNSASTDGVVEDFESYDGTGEVVSEGGPPNQAEWTLDFEDDFDGASLDTDKWEIGFGWGMGTNTSDEEIRAENVWVEDSLLHLQINHDGGPDSAWSGCVNTKNLHPYGFDTYFEAKINAIDRYGMLSAFWSKPNDEAWPPEIDFFERLENRNDQSTHNVHYSTSTQKGDSSTEDTLWMRNYDHFGGDVTDNHDIYGCAWFEDRVEMYVNGNHVGTHTDSTAMQALANGTPFYMMLNVHIGKTGDADYSVDWGDTMTVDWCRVWTHGGTGGGIPEGWSGSGFSVTTSDPLEGSQSLVSTAEHTHVGTDQIQTARGEEYRCLVQVPNDTNRVGMLTNVQDPQNPFADCYWWQFQPEYDKAVLYYRKSGETTIAGDATADTSLDAGTTYELVARVHDDTDGTLEIGVEDTNGNVVAPYATYTDSTHGAGYFGFHTSGGTGELLDSIARYSL